MLHLLELQKCSAGSKLLFAASAIHRNWWTSCLIFFGIKFDIFATFYVALLNGQTYCHGSVCLPRCGQTVQDWPIVWQSNMNVGTRSVPLSTTLVYPNPPNGVDNLTLELRPIGGRQTKTLY